MEYQVLARKWRPQSFADVVGQTHITHTLQNELIQDKTAHAYLFVGPRGIGKTSIARIFAKAMNCKNAPVKEPCCQCESCLSIAEGNSLDLIEIDGASNNSVEDIRQLREEVLYSPTSSRYKIYIIDEVHMLTNSAWNALLKTIEEPPPHAKFLFATTEAHKVLATVVSRCQRFDLQRLTFKLITEQLKKIAVSENVNISDSAIDVIARAADGGMRDAQSLLDQMIAFSSADQGEISEEQSLAIFGLTGIAEMERLILAILKNDRASLIASIHQLSSQGKNLEKLFEDILSFLRGIQICMIMQEPEKILETGEDIIALYRKAAAESNPVTVQKLLENLSPVGRMLHDAVNKQVFLETILLKAMRVSHAVEIETLINRLNQIRKGGELGELETIPSVTQHTADSTVPPIPPQTTPEPTQMSANQAVAPPNQVPVPPPVQNTPQPIPEIPPPPPIKEKPQEVTLQKTEIPVPDRKENVLLNQNQHIPNDQQSAENKKVLDAEPQNKVENVDFFASAPNPVVSPKTEHNNDQQPSEMPPPFPAMPPENNPDVNVPQEQHVKHILNKPKEPKPVKPETTNSKLQTPEAIWHTAIENMGYCKQPLIQAYMQEGRVESYINGELTIVYDEEVGDMTISEIKKAKPVIETCIKRVSNNKQIVLRILDKKEVESPHENLHQNERVFQDIKERAEKNPFVKDVMDLFDASIIDVRG